MEQFCKIEILGYVGGVRLYDYEGRPFAKLSVLTSFAYKDKEGAAVIDDQWHNVTAWDGKNIHDLDKIQKGDKIHIFGRPRIQKYTGADGIDRIVDDVLATKIEIIDGDEQLAVGM